jgi:hypothetical protein
MDRVEVRKESKPMTIMSMMMLKPNAEGCHWVAERDKWQGKAKSPRSEEILADFLWGKVVGNDIFWRILNPT